MVGILDAFRFLLSCIPSAIFWAYVLCLRSAAAQRAWHSGSITGCTSSSCTGCTSSSCTGCTSSSCKAGSRGLWGLPAFRSRPSRPREGRPAQKCRYTVLDALRCATRIIESVRWGLLPDTRTEVVSRQETEQRLPLRAATTSARGFRVYHSLFRFITTAPPGVSLVAAARPSRRLGGQPPDRVLACASCPPAASSAASSCA